MGNYTCFLVTVLSEGPTLLRCAVKIPFKLLTEDQRNYPMEPENRERIKQMLPLHVQNAGEIVAIEDIFAVFIA